MLSYLPPDGSSSPRLDRLFRRVAAALESGGLFVFDLVVSDLRGPELTYRRWWSEPGWAILIESIEERTRARDSREITTFVKRRPGRDACFERRAERHLLRVSEKERVVAALRRAGFRVRLRRRLGAFALPPRRVFFVARLARRR